MSTVNFSVTIKAETLEKLDRIRGLIPRSTFIEKVLSENLKENKTKGGGK